MLDTRISKKLSNKLERLALLVPYKFSYNLNLYVCSGLNKEISKTVYDSLIRELGRLPMNITFLEFPLKCVLKEKILKPLFSAIRFLHLLLNDSRS